MIEYHFPDLELREHAGLGIDYGVCPKSGTLYYRAAEAKTYEGDYFLAEYAAQYGRTYVEDESHLRELARRRLALLKAPVPARNAETAKPRLLEIGCAAGFFLDEARLAGYQCAGLEISQFAADYGRHQLGLDIKTASFLDVDLEPQAYDVIAAFYVIEHFARQRSVFQKIADALKPGGVFIFAVPSTNGPLFEYDLDRWRATHPTDHHADYSPASLRRLSPAYGLVCERVRPASFHPERARGWKGLLPAALYRAYARACAYGDTIEGAARKKAA
ncbi:MAG: class I SAM-dependent methyltransferase [Leptospirales bacterium]